jgi:hypothetical protein
MLQKGSAIKKAVVCDMLWLLLAYSLISERMCSVPTASCLSLLLHFPQPWCRLIHKTVIQLPLHASAPFDTLTVFSRVPNGLVYVYERDYAAALTSAQELHSGLTSQHTALEALHHIESCRFPENLEYDSLKPYAFTSPGFHVPVRGRFGHQEPRCGRSTRCGSNRYTFPS